MILRHERWERHHSLTVVSGLTHFVLGFGLQLFARQGLAGDFLFILATPFASLGLVITGGLPVLLWDRYRLVLPGMVTVGWFTWGIYGIWTIRRSLPWGPFDGISWNSLPPYPDYMMKVNLLLIGIVVLAAAELLFRKVGGSLLTGGAKTSE
ncbi:hypothetical protein ACFQRB_17990 [Halobaculum litoreum]|uniref:Uncharacterized protein n=1 Tax=Halobaculum litoreum TaxID=3031998 RepID=A0ABD5XWF8_9EURY